MDKDYNPVPMKIVANMVAIPVEELEALRKDAKRYLWLRDNADGENEGDCACSRILFETAPEVWDAAIDAAIGS